MFTVKVERVYPLGSVRTSMYEAVYVDKIVDEHGRLSVVWTNRMGERPVVTFDEPEDESEAVVARVIVENANGRTTDVVTSRSA